jgi:maleate isomerase
VKHIGLIVPSSNTSTELDFAATVPPDVACHSARMFMVEASFETARAFVDEEAPRAARELGTLEPDAIVFACTAAGAALGPDGEPDFVSYLRELGGAPVISTNVAVAAEIATHAPARIAILTPYTEEATAAVALARERDGYTVAAAAGMAIELNRDIGRVTPRQLLQFADDALDGIEFDLLFVSCTNLRTAAAVELLEGRFGRPVVTSNLASVRAALTAIAGDQ